MLQIVFEYLLRTDANFVCHPFLGTLEKKNTKNGVFFTNRLFFKIKSLKIG
jgi:hypothetical protein